MINLFRKDEVDFSHNGLGSLDNAIINPLVEWHDNGAFTLEFKYPIFAKHGKEIENSSIIKANDANESNLFFVYKVIPSMGYISVYCYQISYKLAFNAIDDTFIVSKNGQQALQQIASSTQYPHNFHFSSDILTIANSRVIRKNVIEFLLDSKLENSFISRWGGHIIRQNFNIAMNTAYSNSSKNYTIRHRKDLKGYSAEIDESTVVTRIRPIGYDGLMLPELYVDSPLLNAYVEPRIQEYEYSDVKVKQKPDDEEGFATIEEAYAELRRLAKLEFTDNMVDVAHATYKVEFVALADTEEYMDLKSLAKLKAGDTVTVIHEEDGLDIKAQIVEYSYNPLSNSYSSITLGNFQKTFSSTITKLVDNKVKEATEIAETALISANGKNKITHGSAEPLNPKEGDSWVRPNPDDISESQWLIWDNEKWVTEMDSATQVKKGHVISSINVSEEEILIEADKIHISGKTKIDDASITGAKILNLDAGKITAGTLNAANVNVINLNAKALTAGTISGTNLSMNLDTGSVQFQKGYIAGNNNKIRFDLDNSYLHSVNTNGSGFQITNGQLSFFDGLLGSTPQYLGAILLDFFSSDSSGLKVYGNKGASIQGGNSTITVGYSLLGNNNKIGISGDTGVTGNLSVLGKLSVTGSKNAVHVTRDGVRATPAYETAESYLGDIGRSYTRENYEVWVEIDPLFSDTVNTDISYEVFLQAYSDARFWVEDFKSSKFLVKSDKPMARFAWELKAKRRGYENERLVLQESFDNKMLLDAQEKGVF